MRAAVAEWPSWLTATWAFRTQFSLLLQILKCVCVCMCFKLPFCKMGTVSSPRQSCRGHHRQRPAPHTRGAMGPEGARWRAGQPPGQTSWRELSSPSSPPPATHSPQATPFKTPSLTSVHVGRSLGPAPPHTPALPGSPPCSLSSGGEIRSLRPAHVRLYQAADPRPGSASATLCASPPPPTAQGPWKEERSTSPPCAQRRKRPQGKQSHPT
uniref:Uncharacterized protein n=1 Tax=Mustela putorius furo TaxID=9669 RepID=M3XUA9_MUSPF